MNAPVTTDVMKNCVGEAHNMGETDSSLRTEVFRTSNPDLWPSGFSLQVAFLF